MIRTNIQKSSSNLIYKEKILKIKKNNKTYKI